MAIHDEKGAYQDKFKSLFSKCMTSKKTVALVFALYFLCGIFCFADYGISSDESIEHYSSIINYVHEMAPFMHNSEHFSVRAVAEGAPELADHQDRFYGTALQGVTVFIEQLFKFEMNPRDIYQMRHAFVFLNYYVAALCFYFILKRRFGYGVLPLLGTLAFILTPRFFGESFYNIKDILFFSWMVISGYFTLRWLQEKQPRYYFFAAAALAITINTRILGLSMLLLACAFAVLIAVREKAGFLSALGRPLALFALTIGGWILITPFLREDPIQNIIDTIVLFMNFSNWDGEHLYMGEMISRHVPWHYIPVWMGVTIPIPYILMFIIGVAFICVNTLRWFKRRKKTRPAAVPPVSAVPAVPAVPVAPHNALAAAIAAARAIEEDERSEAESEPVNVNDEREAGNEPTNENAVAPEIGAGRSSAPVYDVFMAALFFCTLIGFIVLQISMYEGWRHAYGAFFQNKHIVLRRLGGLAIAASLAFQLVWICANHPYEYVYFNSIGRHVAEQNFTLDYWEVSYTDLIRHVLSGDGREKIMIYGQGNVRGENNHFYLLTDEERERVLMSDIECADYYVQNTRRPYAERVANEGFAELASVQVDGMKISTVYKRVKRTPPEMDDGAARKIIRAISNISGGDLSALFDNDSTTSWTTGREQQQGDYILIEFSEPVDYNYFYFESEGGAKDYMSESTFNISWNGMEGARLDTTEYEGGYCAARMPGPYRFLVIENTEQVSDQFWSIDEMRFGHIK